MGIGVSGADGGERAGPPARGTGPGRTSGLLQIDLERFQGPLDLLLHLIRQQDIDIFDIPIATITDQFLTAVQELGVEDLDSAGEFLETAATLIRIKAQMLLPRPMDEEDEDPAAQEPSAPPGDRGQRVCRAVQRVGGQQVLQAAH